MGDQPFWGKRVFELGVGPAPIRQKELSVEKPVRALQSVTSNTAMIEKAAELGNQIRKEDGIANAITVIEKAMQ